MHDARTLPQDPARPPRADLHAAADRLVEALRSGRAVEIAPLADRLLAAARERFDAEERALATRSDAGLVRHAFEHARFLGDLAAVAELARRGDVEALMELKPAEFIQSWLAAHARTDQGALAPARAANG